MKKTGEGDQFQHAGTSWPCSDRKVLTPITCTVLPLEGRDANNQKVYFVTVTVDYQQIIEKQEFNGLELCTGLPQFPVLKQEEKGGK